MAYEIWCHSCNVTFPTGTKTCLHCGSRTRPDRPHRGSMQRRSERELTASPLAFDDEAPAFQSVPDLAVSGSTTEPEAGPGRRSLLRAGMTYQAATDWHLAEPPLS